MAPTSALMARQKLLDQFDFQVMDLSYLKEIVLQA
jgi:hypothetical protein